MHPLGGTLLFAARFVRNIAKNQPLLGIEARGVDGREPPFESIPEAAHHYLELLLSRQPRGPYFLGGPSFGGNLAYEMAQLLTRRGAEVAMLALFDAHGPNYPRPVALHQRLRNHLHRLRTQRALGLFGPSRSSAEAYAMARIPEGDSQLLRDLRSVSLAHTRALRSYRPAPYAGSVQLFRALTQPDWPGMVFADATNGWQALVPGGVHVISVPGMHQHLLDPPWVDTLAAEFSRALAEAQARASDARACAPSAAE